MTMDFKKISAGVITMMVLMGNAHAVTTSCPAVSDIKQTAEGQGFTYTATAPNGQKWTGENPMADESDLQNVTFKMAAIRSTSSSGDFVACDYEGKKNEAVRMTLKTQAAAKPVGIAWKEKECKETNPALCTFE
ncbi:DUF3757 domain-containing protein [Pseudomonas sp. 10B1]|uniref:DUF3757 domain-containing protein n=1 Tax=unclassified Pseudomonas TaxID=196821 RepID=UPI002AB3951F|nr:MULTISPECIES: DUF3757 domain-containing protein [unclassified Pseudomonas]MDY7563252.1 DUF3757 domain-containing protein [Pseudomonas sp. AB6]MEA9977648.1 DUF3757 domain-containing protein [Pseudomonas sp. RTS4]MEA9993666.1 DUF3757 domain-containing protein [Pseudomonas sp. AA4]MEB0085007.1 DUF3757 domain-containing protein [Pseudomonas sp. RTI1]MEB0125110.1 DUF3757 domain-containing protein [Pseudomonas sp. CCC1.2]